MALPFAQAFCELAARIALGKRSGTAKRLLEIVLVAQSQKALLMPRRTIAKLFVLLPLNTARAASYDN